MTDMTTELYWVVKNSEEQYSIWRNDREPPNGWFIQGEAQTKEECLQQIEAEWTDMRPLSLRKALGVA